MTLETHIDWRPSATVEALKLRAQVLQRVRAFFAARAVLEVETPILSCAATPDPNLHSFSTHYHGPSVMPEPRLFLHTSPEFAMKRLLAAGSGSIFQVCKVFRDSEAGDSHNPEFTMLEWYRLEYDYQQLMDEVTEFIKETLAEMIEFKDPPERLTYREVFHRHLNIDPFFTDIDVWKVSAKEHGLSPSAAVANDDVDAWRDYLFSHVIQPHLGHGHLTFVYDYPASQASLANIRQDLSPVAERFELFLSGIELANGFSELTDVEELRRRFQADQIKRRTKDLPQNPVDEALLAACEEGLPVCAGVALGFDRLLMLAAKTTRIENVIAFPIDIA